ncbi:MAG TPA: hypothetical protein VFR09_06900 [Alphaproteobacteria bacterium]|nr:hypothetical protein [Alphaproteobacteria bacterium]
MDTILFLESDSATRAKIVSDIEEQALDVRPLFATSFHDARDVLKKETPDFIIANPQADGNFSGEKEGGIDLLDSNYDEVPFAFYGTMPADDVKDLIINRDLSSLTYRIFTKDTELKDVLQVLKTGTAQANLPEPSNSNFPETKKSFG